MGVGERSGRGRKYRRDWGGWQLRQRVQKGGVRKSLNWSVVQGSGSKGSSEGVDLERQDGGTWGLWVLKVRYSGGNKELLKSFKTGMWHQIWNINWHWRFWELQVQWNRELRSVVGKWSPFTPAVISASSENNSGQLCRSLERGVRKTEPNGFAFWWF